MGCGVGGSHDERQHGDRDSAGNRYAEVLPAAEAVKACLMLNEGPAVMRGSLLSERRQTENAKIFFVMVRDSGGELRGSSQLKWRTAK